MHLLSGERVQVPASTCAVDRQEEGFQVGMLHAVFATDEEDRFEHVRMSSLAERAQAVGGARQSKTLTLREVSLGGRARTFKQLGFAEDKPLTMQLHYPSRSVLLHGKSATNQDVAIIIKPYKICCEDAEFLCVQAREASFHAKKAGGRGWSESKMPVDLSEGQMVSSKRLWQFYVANMPSVEDVAPLGRVCALQDMCVTDASYTTRTPGDQLSNQRGAQVRIPRVCSHPAEALKLAQALANAAQEVELDVMKRSTQTPADFEKDDAPLELVHQPFARRARALEDSFHARVAASDALFVSHPRAAQETQGSESGESGDDEGLHESDERL